MKGSKFLRIFLQTEVIGLGFGVPVASAYVLLLLDMSPENVERILKFVAVAAAVVVGGIAMPINLTLGRKVKALLDKFNGGDKGRVLVQALYTRSMELPFLHAVLLFIRITLGALSAIVYMYFFLHVDGVKCLMATILALYGSYLAAIVAYMATNALVRPIGREIVGGGLLDELFIKKRKIFGMGVIKRSMLFLLIPMVLTNVTVFFSFYSAYISEVTLGALLPRIGGVLLVNVFTLLVSILLTLLMMRRPLGNLKRSLARLAEGRDEGDESIPTDLSDDFAYISHLINRAVLNFRNILREVTRAADLLTDSVHELSSSSSQLSATSNQQAAAVKEIVSTMEDSDQLAKKIADSVHQVVAVSEKTSGTVESGEDKVQLSLSKMDEIRDSNGNSIEGIRSLGEKIESIWDIVNIINGIANQTKIIAFNAELEASAAGEAGKNFQIVATEIRRLADSTVASTTEIRNKITEIQHSSDEVITASEEGTEIINQGRALSQELNTVFRQIKEASGESAESAAQIEGSVNQQVASFEQILLTLRMISDGIDNFASSTAATSRSSEQLKEMAESLNRLVKGSRGDNRDEEEQA